MVDATLVGAIKTQAEYNAYSAHIKNWYKTGALQVTCVPLQCVGYDTKLAYALISRTPYDYCNKRLHEEEDDDDDEDDTAPRPKRRKHCSDKKGSRSSG